MKIRACRNWGLLAAVAMLTACSYAMPYESTVVLPETGDAKLAVATVDERPYVLNGKNPPEYVGIIRGGYGNPFNRDTDDGKPLADDFSASIANSLTAKGFQVITISTPPASSPAAALQILQHSGAHRLILVELRDWQSDTMINPTVNCDVTLHIYDSSGRELASVKDAENYDMHGGSIFSTPGRSSDKVYQFYEHKITEWFSDPKIEAAIQD
ncbi:MAG: hypothetical protein ACRESA_04435 [Gammaproteobacteria bacterium]